MGMNNNFQENFTITSDGTIKRSFDDLDKRLLNIIRLGATKSNTLAAYKARKKCYEICMNSNKHSYYKEHVELLQFDNFPNEFKKAELGEKYYILLTWITIPCVFITLCSLVLAFIGLVYWFEFGIGMLLVSTVLAFVDLFLFKKLKSISKVIKEIKQ